MRPHSRKIFKCLDFILKRVYIYTHTHVPIHTPSGNVASTTVVKHFKNYFPEIGISSRER